MPVLEWANHHRLLVLGAGATLVIAVAAGLWFFVFRDSTTPVGLDQALRLYRQGQSHGTPGHDPRLPPGVYRFRTSGGEQLSMGDITRTFPAPPTSS